MCVGGVVCLCRTPHKTSTTFVRRGITASMATCSLRAAVWDVEATTLCHPKLGVPPPLPPSSSSSALLFQQLCLFSAACWSPTDLNNLLFSFPLSLLPGDTFQTLTTGTPSVSTVAHRGLHVKDAKYSALFFYCPPPSPTAHPLSVSCAAAVLAASKANVFIETKEVCHWFAAPTHTHMHRHTKTHTHTRRAPQLSREPQLTVTQRQDSDPSADRCGTASGLRRTGAAKTYGGVKEA